MNPKSTDIFGRLDWLTKFIKRLSGRVKVLEDTGGGCGDCPVSVDGVTITGDGTVADPLVAVGGGGGTNPTDTFLPYNNAGTFADANIAQSAGYLASTTPGTFEERGFRIDWNNKIYEFGDWGNGWGLTFNQNTELVGFSADNGTSFYGLVYDYQNNIVHFGDYSTGDAVLSYDSGTIQTSCSGYNVGIQIDGNSNTFKFGDYSSSLLNNGACLNVDAANKVIKSQFDGGFGVRDMGLKLDFGNNLYKFGYINNEDPLSSLYFEGTIGSLRTMINGLIDGFYAEPGYYNLGKVSGGEFNLSMVNDGVDQYAKFLVNNSETGLKLDFINANYSIGDLSSNLNGTHLSIEDGNSAIRSFYGGNEIGMYFNFGLGEYSFGDMNGYNNGLYFIINDASQVIKTSLASGGKGLYLDFGNNEYLFGDFNYLGNGTTLVVDDNNSLIKTTYGNNNTGLLIDYINNRYLLGDYNGLYNTTWIDVNDGSGFIQLNVLNGAINVNRKFNFLDTSGSPAGMMGDNFNAYGLDFFNMKATNTNTGIAFLADVNGDPSGLGYIFQFEASTTARNGLIFAGDNASQKHTIATSVDGTGSLWPLYFRVSDSGTNWGSAFDMMKIEPLAIYMGDADGNNNNTKILVDDNAGNISFVSSDILYLDDNSTGNMIANTSGGASSNYLVININGTTYHINLETP